MPLGFKAFSGGHQQAPSEVVSDQGAARLKQLIEELEQLLLPIDGVLPLTSEATPNVPIEEHYCT
ncbi:MAG: hypothetical protein ACREN8_14015, partial [Candidatus Dormibacteraceae bacterium]